MSFSKEISDFVGGFQSGWKMMTPTAAELAYKDKKEEREALEKSMAGEAGKVSGKGFRPTDINNVSRGGSSVGGSGGRVVDKDIEDRFIGGLKSGGLTNPYGLAAVAAYGGHEGGYSKANVMGSWSDPAESGSAGTSGGLMSWRDDRLTRMRKMTAGAPDPVVAQAKYTLIENPELTMRLQKAKSAEEANDLMAKAWRFAGYNRAGGEYASRLQSTKAYLPRFTQQSALPMQSLAEGGRVRELDEMHREAMAASMASEDVPVVIDADWQEPAVQPEQAAPVQPEQAAPVQGIPVGATIDPTQMVTARNAYSDIPRAAPAAARLARAVTPQGNNRPTGIPARASQPQPQQEQTYDPRQVANTGGIGEAIRDGLSEIGKFFGFDTDQQSALPQARANYNGRYTAFSQNQGAATQDEIDAVDKTIDPDGRLTQDARSVARLYGGYKYYMNKGEPDKAKKYAMSMLMAVRGHMQVAGAVAADHIQSGDLDTAARAISEGHNEVPDGNTLKVGKAANGRVPYKVYDEYGDLTAQGEATQNDLMRLATGMQNGTEWFRQMGLAQKSSMTAAQKAKEGRIRQDEDAIDNFDAAAGSEDEFLGSLNPEQKKAYMDATVKGKAALRRRWLSQQKEDRANTALGDRQAKEDERRAKADRKAQDEQEYAGHITEIQNAQDALNDARQRDPEDEATLKPLQEALDGAVKNARDWTKADGGRASFIPRITRDTRTVKGGSTAASAGGTGSTSGTGRGGSKDERMVAGLEAGYQKAVRAANRAGADPSLKQGLPRLKSQVEFAKRDTGFDAEDLEKINEKLVPMLGVSEAGKIDPEVRNDWHDAVTGILRGDNNIGVDQAMDLAGVAAKTGAVRFEDDGRVRFGAPGKQTKAIYISPEGMSALVNIWKRNQPKQEERAVGSAALPLTKAEEEDAGDAAVRVESRRAASAAAKAAQEAREMAALKQRMGSDYQPGMTLQQMRRAAFTRDQRNRRLNPEEEFNDQFFGR